jgi:glutathione S-transferase
VITLFHSPDSRSSRFIWLLEELGVDYEIVYCSIARRSGKGAPDPRNPHPDKRVPALLHDDILVTEQAAIALYLTDLYPDAGLGATIGARERGPYLTWLAFNAGEIDMAYTLRAFLADSLDPITLAHHKRVTARVAAALEGSPYLLGERFTAADILVSGAFEWDAGLQGDNPAIRDWLARLSTRPAAQRMLACDAPDCAAS